MNVSLALLVVFLTASKPCCSHTLTAQQLGVLNTWLKGYPTYRLATDRDSDCPAQIAEMRTQQIGVWKPVPDYHPYQVGGDVNADGTRDFAG